MRDIKLIINELWEHIDDPSKGLPEELFLFISQVTPLINVDLLVRDKNGSFLLSWRKDKWDNGWHIPGGIVRVKETLQQRLEATAQKEIGSLVNFNPKPLMFSQEVHPWAQIRPHFYSFLYDCTLPNGFEIDNKMCQSGEAGYLQWHNKFPDDMIFAHHKYKKFFSK
ncbi:MAG: hypothetical protein Ta2B_08960 [Termitinemataceae bacterium]|nr:MAG: hypothetical protein Ta2B_08960 [Termitinemataceae bacterium]